MGKVRKTFVCRECGAISPKWLGRCGECEQWNTLEEQEPALERSDGGVRVTDGHGILSLAEVTVGERIARDLSGIHEVDRCLGSGVARSSLILIGGEPGIGKSTLILQLLFGLLKQNPKECALYVSGEESVDQVAQRARRLFEKDIQLCDRRLLFLAETCLERIEEHIKKTAPKWVVVDSIQTSFSSQLETASGTVNQLREVALRGMRWSKDQGHTVFLIGHVTKEGAIAGPKMLEHMVDTVLYFEGEGKTGLRLLRTVKNRFGTTSEVGVFEMGSRGLEEIRDSGLLYRTLRKESAQPTGSSLCCVMEGARPFATEIQALVAGSGYGNGRRTSLGFDSQRVAIAAAILEKYAGVKLVDRDIFVSTVGGLRISDPGADLSLLVAILSSALSQTLSPNTAFIGEVTLTGEVRSVSFLEQRVTELARLGIDVVFTGPLVRGKIPRGPKIECVESIGQLKRQLWGRQEIVHETFS